MGMVWKLEEDLMPIEFWDDYEHNFPDHVQKELGFSRLGMSAPIGIGWNEDTGWFCLCSGQGPFMAWSEKGEENG